MLGLWIARRGDAQCFERGDVVGRRVGITLAEDRQHPVRMAVSEEIERLPLAGTDTNGRDPDHPVERRRPRESIERSGFQRIHATDAEPDHRRSFASDGIGRSFEVGEPSDVVALGDGLPPRIGLGRQIVATGEGIHGADGHRPFVGESLAEVVEQWAQAEDVRQDDEAHVGRSGRRQCQLGRRAGGEDDPHRPCLARRGDVRRRVARRGTIPPRPRAGRRHRSTDRHPVATTLRRRRHHRSAAGADRCGTAATWRSSGRCRR